ncbi:sulfurtransferase TusA family protein, partial [Klebsiella pneumoniae]
RGLKCPLPVLRTRKALATLPPDQAVEVVCTDPMAAIDIPNLAREEGRPVEALRGEDGVLVFRIGGGERPA